MCRPRSRWFGGRWLRDHHIRMSTASGYVCLIIDPVPLTGLDAIQPCNRCTHGSIMAPEHLRGEHVFTYQPVDCPLCGQTSLRTRPQVMAQKPA